MVIRRFFEEQPSIVSRIGDDTPTRRLVLATAAFEGGLGLVAVAIGWLLGESPWGHIHWNSSGVWWGVAATLPMLAGLAVCLYVPLSPLLRLKELAQEVIRPLFAGCTLLELAVIAIAAGLGEELLFRGVLQYFLVERFGTTIGLVVASLAFGLVHPLSTAYVVLAAVIGVYLGWLWLEFDNLLVPIVAHALYDFVALVYLVRGTGGAKKSAARPISEPDRRDRSDQSLFSHQGEEE